MNDPLSVLHHAGLEPTPLRIELLQALALAHRPLSARELLDDVRQRQPINKVTLYRNLDMFAERGLITKVHAGEKDNAARYCLRHGSHEAPHVHFYCRRCGEMECLDDPGMRETIAACHFDGDRRIEDMELRLEGVCGACCHGQTPMHK
ncbi:MAG: transcriptional repressor [Desulfovibrio sp.]|nr:transcriptional repressor [Desulfovibrio sp.]MCA1984935.1 transcriptional repressor [Desulfovibrio sp.]